MSGVAGFYDVNDANTTPSVARTNFKNYCLRALGDGVIKINVSDTQVEDRINQSLQTYQAFHFDGKQDTFLRHAITDSMLTVNQVGDLSALVSVGDQIINTENEATATVTSISGNTLGITNLRAANGQIANEAFGTPNFVSIGDSLDVLPVDSTTRTDIGEVVSLSIGDRENRFLSLSDQIIGVNYVYPTFDYGTGTTNIFSFEYQYTLNELPYLYGGSLANYQISREYLQTARDAFSGATQFRFHRHQNRLHIDHNWADGGLGSGQVLLIDATVAVNPDIYTDVYNDEWLKKYCTALIQMQWGNNLSKLNGVQLPGGVSLDGASILSEAKEMIDKLEEELKTVWQEPQGEIYIG